MRTVLETKSASIRAAFVKRFEPSMLPHVFQFANTVSDLDHDVLMFTARKAACLFDALQEVGLASSAAILTSDRVRDMDSGWLAGKRVAVVDDLIITGSTLAEIRASLSEKGVASVDVCALAVDKDYWIPELAMPLAPFVSLDNNTSLNLCTQIVQSLAVIPRPYNLDWPIIEAPSVPVDPLLLFAGLPGWTTVDCTTEFQRMEGVLSITHEPHSEVEYRLLQACGYLPTGAGLAKVRVYARPNRLPERGWTVRIVPIVALDGLSRDRISSAFDLMIAGLQSEGAREFYTTESKLRFIQFTLSARLGDLWLDDASMCLGQPIQAILDEGQLAMAFSPPSLELVREAARSRELYLSPEMFAPSNGFHGESATLPMPVMTVDFLQRELTKSFIDLYLNKEIIIRKKYRTDIEKARTDPLSARLKHGIGIDELARVASIIIDDEVAGQRATSRFLDIAIDAGAVVPITEFSGSVVKRTYRHGEDIVFTESEIRLFALMLRSVAKSRGTDVLDRIVVEKLSVLFMKAGLDQALFEPWTGKMGKAKALGVRYHLKGAVLRRNMENLYGANQGQGIADILIDAGHLAQPGKSRGYAIGNISDIGPLTPRQVSFAKEFGSIWGPLVPAAGQSAEVSHGELIHLATCSSAPNTCAALGAEVAITTQSWADSAASFARRFENDPQGALTFLRKSHIYEAVTSGVSKYDAYTSGRPKIVFDRVRSLFAGDDLRLAAWEHYRPTSYFENDVESSSPDVVRVLDREARWLLTANGLVESMLAVCLAAAGGTRKAISIRFHKAEAVVQRAKTMGSHGRYSSLVRRAFHEFQKNTLDHKACISELTAELDNHIADAVGLLAEGRALAKVFGQPRTVLRFPHALFVEASGTWISCARALGMANEEIGKIIGKDKRVRIECVSIEGAPTGTLFVGLGVGASQRLAEAAKRLLQRQFPDCSLRCHLILNLREREQIVREESNPGGFESGAITERLYGLHELTANEGWTIAVTDCDGGSAHDAGASIGRFLCSANSGLVARRESEEVKIDQSKTVTYRLGVNMGAEVSASADVGIVSIIPEEIFAVRKWLERLPNYSRDIDRERYFHKGELATDSGLVRRIVATQADRQGETSTALAFQSLVDHCNPKLIVLLGTAGGIHKDVACGDVVMAEFYIDYGHSKVTESGTLIRGEGKRIPTMAIRAMNDFFGSVGGPMRLPSSREAKGLGRKNFQIVSGPIATGPAVVAYRDSEIRQWIHQVNDKILAVETEAAGIGQAFCEFTAGRDQNLCGYLIIRGISDHADEDKDDKWKIAASRHAVSALEQLITNVPEILAG